MEMQRRRFRKFWILLLLFVVAAGGVLIGVQYFTKTGWFAIPGEVIYDISLTDEEKTQLEAIFTEEIELKKDVYISATENFYLEDLPENAQLVGIYVPVTDFYSTKTSVSSDEVRSEEDWQLVSLDELDNKRKLLAIDENYYLDSFDKGAVFRVIRFDSEAYEEEIAPLVEEKFSIDTPSTDTVLTFAQTGVTALSRGMLTKLDSIGDASYFAEKIGSFLSKFDLTHTSNESSFTDFATSDNICSDVRFFDTLTSIGLDIVELTGNHNEDCGDEAAEDSIDMYTENGIKIVGGGKNQTEAAEPLEISQKNTNITFLAYNLSTGGATYDETPGANQYYEEDAVARISAAKEAGDLVIVDIQYYECSAYASETEDATCDAADSAAGDQVGFFRHLVDLGADVVVGTSAHQPQTFETYGDGVIYYGLGNLFFDQVWWPGTTRSLVLAHYFYNGRLLQTKITPTVYDENMQPEIMDEETTAWFIDRLVNARP